MTDFLKTFHNLRCFSKTLVFSFYLVILLISPSLLVFFYTYNTGVCVFIPSKNTEFGVNVDALLSFLSCVPGLTEVDIHSEYLTDIWTSRIMSYLQINPKISHIK